jgi:hypothetical protein
LAHAGNLLAAYQLPRKNSHYSGGVLSRDTKTIVTAALRSAGFGSPEILAVLAGLDGRNLAKAERLPALVTQAEAARLASVSRFTIRKMAAAGKLRPVELLPGLIRYRVSELLGL